MDSWNALIRQTVSLANKVSTQKNILGSIQGALVETVFKKSHPEKGGILELQVTRKSV